MKPAINGVNIAGPQKKGPSAQLPAALVEITARTFCNMIGVDPDREVQVPSPTIAGTFKTVKAWQGHAQHIGERIVEMEAVALGRAEYDALVIAQKIRNAMKAFEKERGAEFEREGDDFKDPLVKSAFDKWMCDKAEQWSQEHG